MSLLKIAPKTKSVVISWHGAYTSMRCIHWRNIFGAALISFLALLLKALACSIGIFSLVTPLPSNHSKGDSSTGIFKSLEKAHYKVQFS